MRYRSGSGWTALIALWMVLLSVPAWSDLPRRGHEEFRKLGVGQLLVAMPHLRDPNFAESVVLLVGYGPTGAAGLIVNRPTRVALASEYPELDEAHGPLFFGGPVELHERLMLVADPGPLNDERPLQDSLYFIHHSALFDSVLDLSVSVEHFRVFAGYAGWGPMQLQREVIRGDWKVLPASAALLFDVPSEELWSRLIRYSGAQMARAGIPSWMGR